MSSSSSSRKRSRWGDSSARSHRPAAQPRAPSSAAPGISDQEAMMALLSSAEAREQERKDKQQNDNRNKSGDRDRGDYSDRRRGEGSRNDFRRDGRGNGGERKRGRRNEAEDDSKSNYYGPQGSATQGDEKDGESGTTEDEPINKEKPDFGLSGALTKGGGSSAPGGKGAGGNTYKGVVLKFQEPPEARAPNTLWRFYVYKGDDQLATLHVSKQSAYLFGRNGDIADIRVEHPSCSSQHAVLQYRAITTPEGKLNTQPYIMDLESTNGTFLNGVQIDSARYYQLKKGDVLKFGSSTREYVLLAANTKSI